jgi:hypothetical protein
MGGTANPAGLLQRVLGTVITGASAKSLTIQVAEKTADGTFVQIFLGGVRVS